MLWDGIAWLVQTDNHKDVKELFNFNRFGDLNEIRRIREFDKEKSLELYSKLDITKKDDLLLTFYLLNPYKNCKQVKKIFDELRSDKFIDIYYVYIFEGTRKHLFGEELTKDFRKYYLESFSDTKELVKNLASFYNLFCNEDSWKTGALVTISFEYLNELENTEYDSLVAMFIDCCDGHIRFNPFDLLKNLRNKKETLKRIVESAYQSKELLISQLLLSMKLDEIDKDIYEFALFFNTHRESIVYGNDNAMSYYVFEQYKPGFIYNVVKVLSTNLTNSHFVEHLFTDEKRLQETISYLKGDIHLIKKLYFTVLKTSQFCDYHGVYIQYLTLVDGSALDEFLDILFDGNNRIEIRSWLFGLNGFVDSFIRHIDKTKHVGLSFFVGHAVNLMPEDVFKVFIDSFIKKHKKEPYKLQSLSFIVFQREKPNTQTILFKTLVENEIAIDSLKVMQLFDGPHSWSGSVVPYLNSTINEMKLLICGGEIKELYVSYLRTLIEHQQKRIREEEIAEFNRDEY